MSALRTNTLPSESRQGNTRARRLRKLYVDQYDQKVWARSLKELRELAGGGTMTKMYVDDAKTGAPYHVGYIVGGRWFYEFTPTRNAV